MWLDIYVERRSVYSVQDSFVGFQGVLYFLPPANVWNCAFMM